MRLYSLAGATGVDHDGVHYEAAGDGGFDFPPGLQEHLHGVAVAGQKQWETAIERQHRIAAEELARMRDPATLYEAVAKIVAAAEGSPVAKAEPEAAKAAPAKAAPAAKAAAAGTASK